MVKRLRRRPLKAQSRVRFPIKSPGTNTLEYFYSGVFLNKNALILLGILSIKNYMNTEITTGKTHSLFVRNGKKEE